MILGAILTIGLFIFLEAFFSGSEMGVISVNRIKMERLAQSKVSNALLLKRMLGSPDRLLSTTLTGTNISVVASSAIFTSIIVGSLGEEYAWVTTAVMTPLVLIFGEAVPKAVFRYYADTITFRIVGILRVFEFIFWPVVWLASFISRILLFPVRAKEPKRKSLFVTREELKLLIKESKKDVDIKPYERAIIHRIFEFGSKKVKEIMVPLKNAVSISVAAPLAELKELAKTSGYSRILVYEGEKEHIVGFANVFDALYAEPKAAAVKDCLRPVLYVSQENPIDKVFYSLQLERKQIVILLNEQDKHAGMVTFKDLLDEIVGED